MTADAGIRLGFGRGTSSSLDQSGLRPALVFVYCGPADTAAGCRLDGTAACLDMDTGVVAVAYLYIDLW